MTKFKKVVPKVPWVEKDYTDCIEVVWSEIKELSRQINEVISRENELREQKKSLQTKISNKTIYINSLKQDLYNLKTPWQEL